MASAPDILPRVSGRLGNPIDLNVTFYRNGVPTDPYAIRKVSVYKSAVQPENLVAEFPVVLPSDTMYPSPISRDNDSSGTPRPGVFHLYWDVPANGIVVPDIFFDVWSYFATDPGGSGATAEEANLNDESLWTSCCNQFWLYSDGFFCDDGLTNIRLGFEPMDIKMTQPETRTIEVGITPLPLYDFDFNKIAPIIPRLTATFTMTTDNCELIIDRAPMRIGLRQGTYRTNPFTLMYLFDTKIVLKGSYQYQVVVTLPNGETRASPYFHLQVS
jgi:hypothetical protein